MSVAFKKFLSSKGILHLVSCPYIPQQNGTAERKHRHILETAITLLTSANLPHNFWYHSCAHAVFLINRMPCKYLSMHSPFFQLFKVQPVLHSLKKFGTTVYPYLRPYNSSKLDARTNQCVFVGYALGYKGVLCYNRAKIRLYISRHVIHDKQTFPFYHSSSSTCAQNVDGPVSRHHHMIVPYVLPVHVDNSQRDSSSSQSFSSENSIQDQVISNKPVTSQSSPDSTCVQVTSQLQGSSPHTTLLSAPTLNSLLPIHNSDSIEVGPSFYPNNDSSLVHPISSSAHPMQTRLKSGAIQRKDYTAYSAQSLFSSLSGDLAFCGYTALLTIIESDETSSYKADVKCEKWRESMVDEFTSLQRQKTWILVAPPLNRNIIGSNFSLLYLVI